ncbi:MAG: acyltransferase [Bdellovibrionota bacterium]|nr:acyltransferase [Bdellovibrionota bacterium]
MNKYVKVLDGLRGISILWVMLHHVPLKMHPWIEFIRVRGDLGVELFFAISGILVTKSMLNTFSKDQSMWKSIREYFVKRAARIFPPFYLTLITLFGLSFFVSSLGEKLSKISAILFSFPTYTYNYAKFFVTEKIPGSFGVFWSLCFEEQFYILLILMFIVFKRIYISRSMVLFILGSLICRVYGATQADIYYYNKMQYYTHLRLDAILLGSLYVLNRQRVDCFFKNHIRPLSILIYISVLIAIVNHRFDSEVNRALNYFLISLSFTGLVIYFLNNVNSHFKKIFEMNILTSIGVVSYEVYLIHQIVNGLMIKFLADLHYSFYSLILIILSFSLAYCFHKFFSSPLNLKIRELFFDQKLHRVPGTNVIK